MGDEDEIVGLDASNGETQANEFQPWWSEQQPASNGVRPKDDANPDFLEDEDMKSLEAICSKWRGGLDPNELELIGALGNEGQALQQEMAASSGRVEGFLAYRRRLEERRRADRAIFGSASGKANRQELPHSIPEDQQNSSPEPSEADTPPLSPRLNRRMSLASSSPRTLAAATPPSPAPSERRRASRYRTNSSGEGLPAGIGSVMDGAMNSLLLLPEEMKISKPSRRHSVIEVGSLAGPRRPLAQAGGSIFGRPISSGRPQGTQGAGAEAPGVTSVRLLPHVTG